jgi:regulator of cell morphogenesis and NO signaling
MTTAFDTVGEIVAADYRTAAIFERHGIDFCCGGARTLDQACRHAGADTMAVLREIEDATAAPAAGAPRFTTWGLATLAEYIVANHHAFVRQQLPLMLQHARRIAEVHGDRHPELPRVAALVEEIADEMTSHMMKEERILFPYITLLEAATLQQREIPAAPFGSVANPIRMMEAEHESAGHAMLEIRELTGGFVPPPDACATYTICLQELQAFEADLHAHVHLENNILFPKASAMEAASR